MFSSVCTAKLYVGSALNKVRSKRVKRVTIDPAAFFDAVKSITAQSFKGATFTKARGLWEGTVEPSVVIDLISPGAGKECTAFFNRAACLARAITRKLDQAAVMVVVRGHDGGSMVAFIAEGDLNSKRCAAALKRVT